MLTGDMIMRSIRLRLATRGLSGRPERRLHVEPDSCWVQMNMVEQHRFRAGSRRAALAEAKKRLKISGRLTKKRFRAAGAIKICSGEKKFFP